MKNENPKFAKRGLTLCGYGNFSFDNMAADLNFIVDEFRRAGLGTIEQPYVHKYRGYLKISSSNNFFTPSKVIPFETYMPYSPDEDPFGTLHECAAAGGEEKAVVRVKENEVLYFKKVVGIDKGGNS